MSIHCKAGGGGGRLPTYCWEQLEPVSRSTLDMSNGRYYLNSNIDYIALRFYLHPNVDPDEDVLFYIFCEPQDTDATAPYKHYAGATKTDETEDVSNNIENGTPYTLDLTADLLKTVIYTFDSGDIDAEDMLRYEFYLNSSPALENWVFSAYARYTKKWLV